jgi:ribosomal protein L7/L12
MDTNNPVTPQEALRYFLANQDKIDLGVVMRYFASNSPMEFFAFLEAVTGKTNTQLASVIVRQQPEVFMRLVTGSQQQFDEAREAARLLKQQGNKVPAIKCIRAAWGFGLKEAKDIADFLSDHIRDRANGLPAPAVPANFSSQQQQSAAAFIKGFL